MTTRKDPLLSGTLYCLLAPLAYTGYNLCLRGVSNKHDSAWITCVQSSVAVAVFGAYLIWQAARGRRALPPWKELLALLAIGLITQIGGVLMVWAMSVLGAGTTVTLQTGVMLAATAILGLIVLGERVSRQQIAAIAMIVVAVAFARMGAESASKSAVAATATPELASNVDTVATRAPQENAAAAVRVLLGIGACVLSGIAFAVLIVGARKTVTSATSPEAVVFLISAMGVVFFGPWCAIRLGPAKLLETPPTHLGIMLLAGAMNLLAFLLLTKALQSVSAVRVNAVNNALQMALTVVAGIALFAEPRNLELGVAIVLSVVGVLMITLAGSAKADVAAEPA